MKDSLIISAETVLTGSCRECMGDMSDFSLQKQAKRYLDGELTLHQLHMYMNDHVIRDFQYGETDAATSSLADFLVGIFAEY